MRLLTLPQIKELTQLSTAGIYRLMSQGRFPKQIKIAERSSRWIESEIMDFITEKMNERN
jgi:prophage regulatory protein